MIRAYMYVYELRLSMYEPPGQENEKKKKKNVQKKGKWQA